jgi:hypothetical protein
MLSVDRDICLASCLHSSLRRVALSLLQISVLAMVMIKPVELICVQVVEATSVIPWNCRQHPVLKVLVRRVLELAMLGLDLLAADRYRYGRSRRPFGFLKVNISFTITL